MTTVVTSCNDATGMRCIDILCQPDGRYRWQECRRVPEDSHGWRVILGCNDRSFGTEAEAMTRATEAVGWLDAGAVGWVP